MNVLVLDGDENQAVACVRSLARAGHAVWVGAAKLWSKAGWSRYCRGQFRYPCPAIDLGGFLRALSDELRARGTTLVLPMTERTTLALSAHRDTIADAGGLTVLPEHSAILRAYDKAHATELAASLGAMVPRTATLRNLEEAKKIANSVHYPAVLKPRSSQEVSSAGIVHATGRPAYARQSDELISAFLRMKERCGEVIAQEYVEGYGAGFFALRWDGEVRAEFAHRRLRDVHPTGSGSSLRVSVAVGDEMRRISLSLLRALDWKGVAMVEFRVRANGTPVFMEINGRFWNSLPLAVYAGADFPKFLAELAQYGAVKSDTTYRTGVLCRWLLGDFRHLLGVLWGAPGGFPGRFPSRLDTLWRFVTPVRGVFHDNFELADPLPELGDWLSFFLTKVPRALAGKLRPHSKSR